FFLWVSGVLQQQETVTPTSGGDWGSRFNAEERRAREYVLRNEDLIKHLITDRAVEQGATRRRPPTETIAVSRVGYERLLVLANSLHQLAMQAEGGGASRAESQLSEFLRTHQANKLNPLDLSRYERLVPKLAQQYGLRASFVVDELQMRGEDRFLAALHEITNHTVKNAVTHGIEPPDVRTRARKDVEGQIRFRGTEDALNFYITITDDGRGIDVDKVAARAVELGVVTADRVRSMSREEKLNLVFVQGLSTAQVQDDNAGRGIGLNSVQELMNRFQGVCEVETESGQGTRWNFRFQKMNVALSCLLVGVQSQQLAVPEHSISTITLDQGAADKDYTRIAEQMVGLIDLEGMLGLSRNGTKNRYIVLLRRDDATVGFRATDVLGKKVLFIQPMPSIANGINVFAGVSITDGKPILVMDAAKVYAHYRNHGPAAARMPAPRHNGSGAEPGKSGTP
ncbi:MAG TPA: ATP-binding protein, partial [bacterium]|nr:ATP-binding protein [bacterium]